MKDKFVYFVIAAFLAGILVLNIWMIANWPSKVKVEIHPVVVEEKK